jgi:hypothetical protein
VKVADAITCVAPLHCIAVRAFGAPGPLRAPAQLAGDQTTTGGVVSPLSGRCHLMETVHEIGQTHRKSGVAIFGSTKY